MLIREENINDYNEIRQLVKNAFLTAEHSDNNEYKLIDNLRKSDGFIKELALVALLEDEIVAHIMFTKIKINDQIGIALAPLAVLVEKQRQGIGLAIVNRAHEIAKASGYELSVVLGDCNFYSKAGYKKASNYGIKAPFDIPEEFYMVLFLDNNERMLNGQVEYVKELL